MRNNLYVGPLLVGFTEIDRTPEGTYVHMVEIFPEFRDQGYFTLAITALVEDARASGVRVYIDLVDEPLPGSGYFTPDGARELYDRIGFIEMFKYQENNVTRIGSTIPGDTPRGDVVVVPEESRRFLLPDPLGEGEAHAAAAGAGLQDKAVAAHP